MHRILLLSPESVQFLPRDRFEIVEAQPQANPQSWMSVRRALADPPPAVVHAVGPLAARLAFAALAVPGLRVAVPPRFVVQNPEPVGTGTVGWLTRRALRSADRVVVPTQAAAERMRKLGVESGKLAVIPPAAGPETPPSLATSVSAKLPASTRVIVCACRFQSVEPALAAAWAFDVLKYALPDVRLVLVGNGPARERVERFARSVAFDDMRIRFAEKPSGFRESADLVWLTEPGDAEEAVTAMRAGKPMVAVDSADLIEILGSAARFVPVGNKISLASATRELLADPEAAAALGEAGKLRSATFDSRRVAEHWAALYDDLFRG